MSPTIAQASGMPSDPAKCPMLNGELQRIRESNPVLASTGCSQDFCQAGRAVHTDEPRVGENRPLHVVERDAEDFLRLLNQESFFDTPEQYHDRLQAVLEEIRTGAVDGIARDGHVRTQLGGNWAQTPRELEFGLRRAWRNARKCVMRSHCEELKLFDLRHVTTSAQMATELLDGISKGFNDGVIQPTVCVFPPRTVNSRGPMIWNGQVLSFAGYEAEDGTVLGDPMNVQLTKDIIALGWEPPTKRTRFDLLPLVAMAEGDRPVIAEIPSNLRKLVEIRHPRYEAAFKELDLKWVPFPALTRLGFDIGGVQYTASPFIGWFMDAEIGVRNLADTFRYNTLPSIIKALGLDSQIVDDGLDSFEDLPEYEQLSMLSRAQQELNYAVHWSFLQAKVSMSDSLSASMKWCRYDDEFAKKNGYRLPADPYWLAPPQGSIIPVWHRGGAPCYQPKPMICKHVQDPIKAWHREKNRWPVDAKALIIRPVDTIQKEPLAQSTSDSTATKLEEIQTPILSGPKKLPLENIRLPLEPMNPLRGHGKAEMTNVVIGFCSSGTIAEKLAVKLSDRVKAFAKDLPNVVIRPMIEPLNALEASDLTSDKLLLLVVSSTGTGDIPANGSGLPALCEKMVLSGQATGGRNFRYAVFGNGDSRYSTSYNGAAIKVRKHLKMIGGIPVAGGLFHGDTAKRSFPLPALNVWWSRLQLSIADAASEGTAPRSAETSSSGSDTLSECSDSENTNIYELRGQDVRKNFKKATLVAVSPRPRKGEQGSLRVTMDIGKATYKEMSCLQVLPVNSPAKVKRALRALCVKGSTPLKLTSSRTGEMATYSKFLSELVDLELPFLELEWLKKVKSALGKGLNKKTLSKLPVLDVLELLHDHKILTRAQSNNHLQDEICLAMPILHARHYSVASSLRYLSSLRGEKETRAGWPGSNQVDIVVKVREGGRFSDVFLSNAWVPALLKVSFVDSKYGEELQQDSLVPYVVVATGAGFGPVRCMLQQRIAITREAVQAGRSLPPRSAGVSLFLGLRPGDVRLTTDVLNEAAAYNLIDTLAMVPSNADKIRVYDKLAADSVAPHLRAKLLGQRGLVYVCANSAAAKATAATFEAVLGGTIESKLGDRYMEEVF